MAYENKVLLVTFEKSEICMLNYVAKMFKPCQFFRYIESHE